MAANNVAEAASVAAVAANSAAAVAANSAAAASTAMAAGQAAAVAAHIAAARSLGRVGSVATVGWRNGSLKASVGARFAEICRPAAAELQLGSSLEMAIWVLGLSA